MSGQQGGVLRERLLLAPFWKHARAGDVGAGDRHARCEGRDRFAVFADLFLVALRDPGQFSEAVAAIGVGLVADLDGGQVRAERAVGGGDLARGGRRFVVGQPDRQQHLPAAAPGEHADRVHLRRPDHARRPRRPRRGGVAPGDVLIRGDAAEAQHAGSQRAQQPHQIAAVGVLRELAERRRLEGQPEESPRHRRARSERIDRHGDREPGGLGGHRCGCANFGGGERR